MSDGLRALGRASGGVLPRLAGGLLSIPVTAGFVALGIGVVVARGLRAGMHLLLRERHDAVPAPPMRRRVA